MMEMAKTSFGKWSLEEFQYEMQGRAEQERTNNNGDIMEKNDNGTETRVNNKNKQNYRQQIYIAFHYS